MALFEALYRRRCRYPVGWFEVGEFSLTCPKLDYDAIEKVWLTRDRSKMTHSQEKSYARRRELDFEGDWVYLQISLMKRMIRFGRKGKLIIPYMDPYQVLKRVCKVSYELELPNELAQDHPVFHVSMIKKCIGNPVSILPLQGLGVDENISYEEVPFEILDRQVKRLRNKEVASVKFHWRNHFVEVATLEAKANIMSRYPNIFPSTPDMMSRYPNRFPSTPTQT
ncbi:uncharacterized protein LOC107013322 [Solanum pennellii]|uniref:Uncharacterized protein LOC107013322 n=1 Tax=Solanum pennellii TaxID=28526 RepID=A0ABM1GBN0_SOLPN|nr:uncharacterized protein LOC107013322 [Solanum pennellii]